MGVTSEAQHPVYSSVIQFTEFNWNLIVFTAECNVSIAAKTYKLHCTLIVSITSIV